MIASGMLVINYAIQVCIDESRLGARIIRDLQYLRYILKS
jgi:hypothetical protein